MRRLMLHLLVAVLAFLFGVTASTLLGRVFGQNERGCRYKRVHVERHYRHDTPERTYAGALSRGLSELPPPAELPDLPEPPPPPEFAKPAKQTRIRISRADGTVRVIERRVEQVR